jgi:hypothetical protein
LVPDASSNLLHQWHAILSAQDAQDTVWTTFVSQVFKKSGSITENIKYLIPRLSLSGRHLANESKPPSPPLTSPLRKKALLIGIQKTREDAVETCQDNDERTTEEDVNAVPKRKRKKKDRDNEGAHKTEELKGPHRDIMLMKEFLIGALYH